MQLDKIGYIYNQIAAVYFSKQNWKESKSAYQKTLVYNPGNIDAQFYIAMINEKQMDWRSASLAYKKVIQLATGDSSLKERIEYSQKKIKELKRKIVLEKRP
jgi:Tfp pilus assembly protein PilF